MTAASPTPPTGLVLVDKPAGWTSHDVVARMRRAAGTRRVGHAGTLDPMATGVLVLGVGWATKLLTRVVGVDKAYEATVRLGQSTLTDDAEGEVTGGAEASAVTDADLDRAVVTLTGPIAQVPSSVSAIKVDGRRSYARVRGGEAVELPARPVVVSRFVVTARRRVGPLLDLDVRVEVSSGTYVRALARDLGTALGVGGHLTALRRTRVGPFRVADAHPLAELTGDAGIPAGAVLGLAQAAGLLAPTVTLDAAATAAFRHGRVVPLPAAAAGGQASGAHAVLDPGGELVGFAERTADGLRPTAVVPI